MPGSTLWCSMTGSDRTFEVGFEVGFERKVKQFRRKHPELDEVLRTLLRDLADDPFQPRLRLHALSGKLKGLHAVRLTRKMRVTLYLVVEDQRVRLVDIGDHDDVYR